jgi:ring-1,2-phenylacetyl-CoA epoxidase subunit PaaA
MTTLDHEPDEALAAHFEATIAADRRIEPRDWMPEGYRRTLIRQIAQHAHSEIIGMQPEGNWIARAPSLRRKAILMAKVQDEAGHGLYLYAAAETLGVTATSSPDKLTEGQQKYSSIFNYPTLSLGRHGRHRLARRRRGDHQPGPAVPLLLRPLRAGDGPRLQGGVVPPAPGLRALLTMMRGTDAQRRWPGRRRPLVVAEPHDVRPARRRLAEHRAVDGLEDQAAHERRAAPALRRHDRAPGRGARRHIPDPELRWNAERGHYDFGEPDWDELLRVISGDGPCNAERIANRTRAHEDGAWVREAAAAHAAKQAARRRGEAAA